MIDSIDNIALCDVFYPSHQEFSNFARYMEKITKKSKSGIFKVIPPKGWKARKDNYKNLEFVIPHPIEQIVSGKEGYYELFLMTRESRTLSKYEKQVSSYDHITEDKTPDEIEKLFWRTIKFSSPLYGADAPGSLFDKGIPWNLSEINSILKKGLDQEITGVTTPYLYIGSWKAMFAWHKEDLDLYSINYLHFGKPKCWYSVKQEDEKGFQEFASKYYSDAAKECSEFLRHKTFLIHPGILQEHGFQLNKCIQLPGEFVVTKCAGYHAGFNMGFNCAEAVNFALNNWINYGKDSKYCKCQKDSVRIDMKVFSENINSADSSSKPRPIKKNPKYKNLSNLTTNNICQSSDTKNNSNASLMQLSKEFINKKTRRYSNPRKKPEFSKKNTEKIEIDNWLCCDKCNKWRKLPHSTTFIKLDNINENHFEKGFKCDFIRGLNCQVPEEKWRCKYTTLKRRLIKVNLPDKKLQKYYSSMKNSL